MEIVVCKDYKTLGEKAATMFAAQVLEKPDSVLGFATGSAPLSTYAHMAKLCDEGVVDFSRASTYNLDEYFGMGPTEEQSYRKFMNDNLFTKINIKMENTHVLNGLTDDPDRECAEYEKAIDAAGGIDMQLLGIGHDGHIGFNEPSDAFDMGTHCVDLTEETIEANKRFFASRDEVPRQAYTMGTHTIMSARKVLMIVSGKDKAEIIKKAFFGPVTPHVPASILQMHPNFVLVADEDALSLV